VLALCWRRLGAAVVTSVSLAGCSPTTTQSTPTDTTTAAEPWGDRPVVDLSIVMDEDLGGARGAESIVFTPDRRICEVVFRAWPNGPTTAREGTSLVVSSATVDGQRVTPVERQAGAPGGAPGTLVQLPLSSCRDEGEEVEVDLDFRLNLAETSEERLGVDPEAEMAWFAGGFPLLAWVREEGWARDHAVELPGETATSEDFELASMTVTAPEEYQVLGTGSPTGAEPATRSGWTEHRFEAAAVRNIAVSVGRMEVETTQAHGVRVRVGVPTAGTRVGVPDWLEAHVEYLARLEELLGDFPYDDLSVTVTPSRMSGIESPTALLYGDLPGRRLDGLVAHELAHQWAYALVGNNQARHPWVDESVATFAQAVVTGTEDDFALEDVDDDIAGYLGYPMAYWAEQGGFGYYYEGVYEQGAAVLLAGREAVGEDRFDAALRDYLRTNAHRVSGPDQVEGAFTDLPEVEELLRDYGAFDGPPQGNPFG